MAFNSRNCCDSFFSWISEMASEQFQKRNAVAVLTHHLFVSTNISNSMESMNHAGAPVEIGHPQVNGDVNSHLKT